MISTAKKLLLTTVSILSITVSTTSYAWANDTGDAPKSTQDQDTGTTIFDRAYLDQFTNATTALDLAERLPGTQPILNAGGGNQRGFSTNQDPLLINGKRLSGKSNGSRAALTRIPADRVLRMEIILGSSPDIKASSSVGFLNIVLKEDEASKGSGTFEGQVIRTRTGRTKFEGGASYSNKTGKLDYTIAARRNVPLTENIRQREETFDGAGVPTSLVNENVSQNNSDLSLTSNLIYNFDNGDQLRINGQYKENNFWTPTTGESFLYDPVLGYQSEGNNFRNFDSKQPGWEIGGDYGTDLGDKTSFKVIALYNSNHRTFEQSEDFLVEGANPMEDFLFTFDRKASEAIIRPSIKYTLNDSMELEFGDELSFNKVSTALGYSELMGGILVPEDLSGSDVTVKETRSETFANFTWKINDKWNLETSLTYEHSKLSQHSAGGVDAQTFKFLRPTLDLRYQITPRDQIQFSVRRNVDQLNFSDFSSSVSNDDDILGANPDLKPGTQWRFNVVYDHTFKNDMGNFKVTYTHTKFKDTIQQIEVSPGVAGVGNAGDATLQRLRLDSTIKFGFVGMQNLKLSGHVFVNKSSIINPFTGVKDKMSGLRKVFSRVELRNDFDSIGLSVGTDVFLMGEGTFYDIDERTNFDAGMMHFWAVFAEYKLNKTFTLTGRFENILNSDQIRIRNIYGGGLDSGIITAVQDRRSNYGGRLLFGLKGTF